MIELPSPDQLFARPYTYALLRAHWFPPRKNFALLKAIFDRVQTLPSSTLSRRERIAPLSARMRFRRGTTGICGGNRKKTLDPE